MYIVNTQNLEPLNAYHNLFLKLIDQTTLYLLSKSLSVLALGNFPREYNLVYCHQRYNSFYQTADWGQLVHILHLILMQLKLRLPIQNLDVNEYQLFYHSPHLLHLRHQQVGNFFLPIQHTTFHYQQNVMQLHLAVDAHFD